MSRLANNTLMVGSITISNVFTGINNDGFRLGGNMELRLTDNPTIYISIDAHFLSSTECTPSQRPHMILSGTLNTQLHPGSVGWLYFKELNVTAQLLLNPTVLINLDLKVVPVITLKGTTLVSNATIHVANNLEDWWVVLQAKITAPSIITPLSELSGLPPPSTSTALDSITLGSSAGGINGSVIISSVTDLSQGLRRGVTLSLLADVQPGSGLVTAITTLQPLLSIKATAHVVFPYGSSITWGNVTVSLDVDVENVILSPDCIITRVGVELEVLNFQVSVASLYGDLQVTIPSGTSSDVIDFAFTGSYYQNPHTMWAEYTILGQVYDDTYIVIKNPLDLPWMNNAFNASVVLDFHAMNSTTNITTLEVSAEGVIATSSVHTASCNLTLIRGTTWSDWDLVATAVMADIGTFLGSTIGLNVSSAAMVFNSMEVGGFVTLQLASSNTSKIIPQGLTINAHAYVARNNDLSTQIESYRSIANSGTGGMFNPTSDIVDMSTYINIFDAKSKNKFVFRLRETNNFPLTFVPPGTSVSAISCTGLVIDIVCSNSSAVTFDFHVGLSLLFALQPTPVLALATMTWNGTTGFKLQASTVGTWPSVFGLSTVSLSNIGMVLHVNPNNTGISKLVAFTMQGQLGLAFGNYHNNLYANGTWGPAGSDFSITAVDSLSTSSKDLVSLASAFTYSTNFGPDFQTVHPSGYLALSVSNHNNGVYTKGVQINFVASFTEGSLKSMHQYLQPSNNSEVEVVG